MNEEDQIKALQDELDKLKDQVNLQQQKVRELQVRINQLKADPEQNQIPQTVRHEQLHFSLENFVGLKLIQFIGIIVLVIGLSIGVKYAIDKDLISEWMRIALAY